MGNDRENTNVNPDEETIFQNIDFEEIIEEVLRETEEENAQDDDNSEDGSDVEGTQDAKEEQEEDAEEEEESQDEEEEEKKEKEKKEKAKNREEKKKLSKERREKAIEFLKSLPKKILVAIVAATSLVGSAVKSLLFGSSSYTLPPDPNPLDKLTKEAEEKEKKEKEEEQRGNGRDRDRGDTSRERPGGNENQEMDEEQERGGDAREDEELPFEEPEQIEENTQGQEQEEEAGNPENQSEEEGSVDEEEKEEGFSDEDIEKLIEQAAKEDEDKKAKEQEEKEEEKRQWRDGLIFAKDAKNIEMHCMKNEETAEALQDVSKLFNGKFYCDRDENGKDCISLIKGNAKSRQIDAEKLLKGDASELAIACKDIGFAKATKVDYTKDTNDSKYVMVALGMCARLRDNISNIRKKENDGKDAPSGNKKMLLAKCDLGKEYNISIHRHAFDGAKYEYSVSGETGRGDNRKQYISHNTDLYQALYKAEQKHEGFLDEFSKKNASWEKSWKDMTSEKVPDDAKSSNIPTGEKQLFKNYMAECSTRILNIADTSVNNSNHSDYQINFNPDSFKLDSEELYKYMYSLEKGNIDGSDTYMHAIALNSKLLHEYMVDTILNYTDLDAKLILNANDLSVGERRELKKWDDKSKEQKHNDITGYLKSGEPIGNKMVEQLIDRLHISKAYQNFCQYDNQPKNLITHHASMEIMSLAKEALKCDSNSKEAKEALQEIVNAGQESCAKAISEYFSQKIDNKSIDNPVMEELMKKSYTLQRGMECLIDSHKNHWQEPENFSPEQKDAKWYFPDNQARMSGFQSMQNVYDTMKFITFEAYDKMIKDAEGAGDIVNVASDIKDIMDTLGISEMHSCDSCVKILCDATLGEGKASDFVENVHEAFIQFYENNGSESLINPQLYDGCTTENVTQLMCDVPQIANNLMDSVNKEVESKDRIDMEEAIKLVCDEISSSDNPWDAFDGLKGDCSSLADSIINPEGMDNQEQTEQEVPEEDGPCAE